MKVSKGFLTVQTDDNEKPVPFFPQIREDDVLVPETIGVNQLVYNSETCRWYSPADDIFITAVQKNDILDLYISVPCNKYFQPIPTNLCYQSNNGTYRSLFDKSQTVDYSQAYVKPNGTIQAKSSLFDKVRIEKGPRYFSHESRSNVLYRTNMDSSGGFSFSNVDATSGKQTYTEATSIWRGKVNSQGSTTQSGYNYSTNDTEVGWWTYAYVKPYTGESISSQTAWFYMGKSTSLFYKLQLPSFIKKVLYSEASFYTNRMSHIKDVVYASPKIYTDGAWGSGIAKSSDATNINNLMLVIDPITENVNSGYGFASTDGSVARANTFDVTNKSYSFQAHLICAYEV